jgi:hypothetical protein
VKRAVLVVAACAAFYVVVASLAAAQLPAERVAMHVNRAGQVNETTTRASAVTYFAGIWFVLALLAVGMLCVLRWTPLHRLNLPHEAYWVTPEHAAVARRMIMWDGAVLFGMPFLALAFIPVDVALTSRDPGTSGPWVLVPIGIWLLATICYAMWTASGRYRPPPG